MPSLDLHRVTPLLLFVLTACTEANPYLDDDSGSGQSGTGSSDTSTSGSGAGSTDDGGSSSSGEGSGNTSTDGSSATPECTQQGQVDPMCDEVDKPYCVDGMCVGCDGLAEDGCVQIDASTPACDASTGLCVECTSEDTQACTGDTPICGEDQTCRPCLAHDECLAGACVLATGECFPESTMLWVDAAADDCQVGNGSVQAPFCTVAEALQAIENQGNALPFSVHIAGFAGLYVETLSVPATHTIALVGPDTGLGAWLSSSQGDTLTMTGATTSLYLRDVHIDNPRDTDAGIDCTDGSLWMQGGSFRGAGAYDGDAVRSSGCDLTLRDVSFEDVGNGVLSTGGNARLERLDLMDGTSVYVLDGADTQTTASDIQTLYAGFRVSGGSLDLSNSFLINMMNPGGVTGDQGAEISISYTTLIADPNKGSGYNDGLECLTVSSVSVRNSIIVGDEPPSVDCPEAVIENSVLDSALGQGSGNVDLQPQGWDDVFEVPGTNFHVLEGSLPEDVAIWRTGDPEADIDGDPRPSVDMTPDYAGADVP